MGSSPSKTTPKAPAEPKSKQPKRTASLPADTGRRLKRKSVVAGESNDKKNNKNAGVKKSNTKVETKPPHNRVIRKKEKQRHEFTSVEEKSKVRKPPGYEESSVKREIERKRRRYVIGCFYKL